MEALISARTAALESASAVIEAAVRAIEGVVISENSATGNVSVVVVSDVVVTPDSPPMVPPPTEPAKEADAKSEAKSDSRAGKKQSWIRIPTRPDTDRLSIHEPRIIFRNVDNLR